MGVAERQVDLVGVGGVVVFVDIFNFGAFNKHTNCYLGGVAHQGHQVVVVARVVVPDFETRLEQVLVCDVVAKVRHAVQVGWFFGLVVENNVHHAVYASCGESVVSYEL